VRLSYILLRAQHLYVRDQVQGHILAPSGIESMVVVVVAVVVAVVVVRVHSSSSSGSSNLFPPVAPTTVHRLGIEDHFSIARHKTSGST